MTLKACFFLSFKDNLKYNNIFIAHIICLFKKFKGLLGGGQQLFRDILPTI